MTTPDDGVAPLETCARCLLHTEPGMACVHSAPYDDLPPAARPCRPVAPGGPYVKQTPIDTCRHGNPESDCPSCAACAACNGDCGTCPYSASITP